MPCCTFSLALKPFFSPKGRGVSAAKGSAGRKHRVIFVFKNPFCLQLFSILIFSQPLSTFPAVFKCCLFCILNLWHYWVPLLSHYAPIFIVVAVSQKFNRSGKEFFSYFLSMFKFTKLEHNDFMANFWTAEVIITKLHKLVPSLPWPDHEK